MSIEKAMTPPEELLFWKERALQLDAKVQDLEAENQTLRQQIGADQVVPPGGHGRGNVVFHRPLDRNQTRDTPEPPQRTTYAADEGRNHENPQESPPGPPSQRLRRSNFKEITFQIETPQSLPSRPVPDRVDKFLADGPKQNKNWKQRREDIGLSDPKSAIRTFFQLIGCTEFSPTPSTKIRKSTSRAEALLQRYESFVRILCQDQHRRQQIKNFVILLHVCLCRVARDAEKVTVGTANEYMNVVLEGKTRGSGYLKKLRTSVLWPIRQAEGLWSLLGNRADEFFLLYGAPIETYRQLWDDSPLNVYPEKIAEFGGKVEKICDFGECQDCHVSFSVPFLVTIIGEGEFTLQQVNKAFNTKLTGEDFEASVYNIFSQLQCILGFYQLTWGQDQDPRSGQGGHESTESAPNEKRIQSLIDGIHHLTSQSTNSLVPKPKETSTKHPQQANPDRTGTVLPYHHISNEVPDANHQGESGLQSDETVIQPVRNPRSRSGIATIAGGVIMGNQDTTAGQSAKRHSDSLHDANGKRQRVEHDNAPASERLQSRSAGDTGGGFQAVNSGQPSNLPLSGGLDTGEGAAAHGFISSATEPALIPNEGLPERQMLCDTTHSSPTTSGPLSEKGTDLVQGGHQHTGTGAEVEGQGWMAAPMVGGDGQFAQDSDRRTGAWFPAVNQRPSDQRHAPDHDMGTNRHAEQSNGASRKRLRPEQTASASTNGQLSDESDVESLPARFDSQCRPLPHREHGDRSNRRSDVSDPSTSASPVQRSWVDAIVHQGPAIAPETAQHTDPTPVDFPAQRDTALNEIVCSEGPYIQRIHSGPYSEPTVAIGCFPILSSAAQTGMLGNDSASRRLNGNIDPSGVGTPGENPFEMLMAAALSDSSLHGEAAGPNLPQAVMASETQFQSDDDVETGEDPGIMTFFNQSYIIGLDDLATFGHPEAEMF